MWSIRENTEMILDRIRSAERRAGRAEGSTTLLAATKTVDPSRIAEAVGGGVRLIGENRVQEAEAKRAHIPRDVSIHMIGHLQCNKARKAVALFDCIQSIDSARLAAAVAAEVVGRGQRVRVMLEVNLAGESTKSGFTEDELRRAFPGIMAIEGLQVEGLMAVPPLGSPDESRPYFVRLRRLAAELFGDGPVALSMGMSHDFEVAVEEGATIVRVGTAIFGERN